MVTCAFVRPEAHPAFATLWCMTFLPGVGQRTAHKDLSDLSATGQKGALLSDIIIAVIISPLIFPLVLAPALSCALCRP